MEPLSQFSILVVDDEEELREAIVYVFKKKGFTVFSANNGKTAFEIVKANKIDLVISDIRMPGGDGVTLLEQIRAYDPKIPTVIFVTGFSDISVEDCQKKGASKVLAKPFDRKELMDSVMQALGVPA